MLRHRLSTPVRTLLTVGLLIAAPIACKDSTGKDQSEAPAQVQIVSGDDQDAVVGTELPNPAVVRVVDEDGRPIRGQLVNFRVTSGGGSVFSGSALTNANGEAQERWTLGTSTATPRGLLLRCLGCPAPLLDRAVRRRGNGGGSQRHRHVGHLLEQPVPDRDGRDALAKIPVS